MFRALWYDKGDRASIPVPMSEDPSCLLTVPRAGCFHCLWTTRDSSCDEIPVDTFMFNVKKFLLYIRITLQSKLWDSIKCRFAKDCKPTQALGCLQFFSFLFWSWPYDSNATVKCVCSQIREEDFLTFLICKKRTSYWNMCTKYFLIIRILKCTFWIFFFKE
jgi:hypothetical protein